MAPVARATGNRGRGRGQGRGRGRPRIVREPNVDEDLGRQAAEETVGSVQAANTGRVRTEAPAQDETPLREQVAEMRTLLHGLVDLIGAGNWPPRAGGRDQPPVAVTEADLRPMVVRDDRAELREPQPDRWFTTFNKTGVQMFDGSREQDLE